jgi:hypothetical protein
VPDATRGIDSPRAVARIDGHVEALGFEVAVVERHRERRGRPLEAPIEGELHGRLGRATAGAGAKDGHGARQPRDPATVD